jgi:hypothetical protein
MPDAKVRIVTVISASLLTRLEDHCGLRARRARFIEDAIKDALNLAEHQADQRARDRAETLMAG